MLDLMDSPQIIEIDKEKELLTTEAGITWWELDKRLKKEAIDTAEATGFKVVGGETLDWSWTDWYPYATSLLKHQPEAIFIIHGGGSDAVTYEIKAIREQGFKGPIMSLGSASPVFVLAGTGAVNCYDVMCNQAYAGDPNDRRQ